MEAIRKETENDLIVDVFFTNIIRGNTPSIGDNRHWWINGVDTGILARGVDGNTPSIGSNLHWWINGVDTGIIARGVDGKTPSIGENGNWQIGGVDQGVAYNGIPTGVIVMWSGTIAAIPAGWKLCNGQGVLGNGMPVPDLQGKFIAGYRQYQTPAGQWDGKIGNSGGAKEVTLTLGQMPAHAHTVNKVADDNHLEVEEKVYGAAGTLLQDVYNADIHMNKAGGDQPHENLPPYYVLAYIIKN